MMKRCTRTVSILGLLLAGGAARADDVSPASNPARVAAAEAWKQIRGALARPDLDAFTKLCTMRYRRTSGENAYRFFQLAVRRRFVWGTATIKYKGDHAAMLSESISNGRKWAVALLLDRTGGGWKLDGVADSPKTAEAYVEKGNPLAEAMPTPPGNAKTNEGELDIAYQDLHHALFWQDKKAFMALATERWRTAFQNSAPFFWKTYVDDPITYVNPRMNVRGERGAVVFDVAQDGTATQSIGLLFILTPRGFRIDGLATNEQQTLAFLHGDSRR